MKKSCHSIYKLIFALSLQLFVISIASAQGVLGVKGENTSTTGIYIKDLKSGEVIFETNATKNLIPASITKSLTSATALSLLDPDFRYETSVLLEKYQLKDGKLSGILSIATSGDPTLDSEYFKDNRGFCMNVAKKLKERGVTEFVGNISIAGVYLDEGQVQSWDTEDTPWSYGAGFYGLNYKDNTSAFWPVTGRTKPNIPNFNVVRHQSSSVDLKRQPGSSVIHVYAPAKTLKNKSWRIVTTMPDPAACLVSELKDALDSVGINYTFSDVADGKGKNLIYVHRSPQIDDILHSLMVRSDNMFAEATLRAFAPRKSRDKCIKKELDLWRKRGMDVDKISICDGSGLSRSDRFSPAFLAGVLEWMSNSKMAKRYTALFPRSGVDGTMKNFCKDNRLAGRLAFKTGSMSGVQCYAGYVLDPSTDEPTHVVVIMVNSFTCPRSELKSAIAKLLLEKLPE